MDAFNTYRVGQCLCKGGNVNTSQENDPKNKYVNKTSRLFQYRLETFTESRSTEWSHEPFNGDGPYLTPLFTIITAIPNVGDFVYCCGSVQVSR